MDPLSSGHITKVTAAIPIYGKNLFKIKKLETIRLGWKDQGLKAYKTDPN